MLNSIAVIVPVLNDAEALNGLLVSIRAAAVDVDTRLSIQVVDGGSSDGSVAVAEGAGANVLQAEKGRGMQLAAGCRAATADWLLMLHADSYLQPDAFKQLAEEIQAHPRVSWGIFGHDYEGGGLAARWALISNRLRFHLLGIAFGDQGIFVRRSVLEAVGGIPELPLMEDVELSLRLRGQPRRSLGRCLTASARRFDHGGWRYLLTVFRLTAWWLMARARGADPEALARRCQEQYSRS